MKPKLEILPPAQLKIWPLLSSTPATFTLYGGTAIALQLAHRISVDFDFFSALPLDRYKLLEALSFLDKAKLIQPEINTLDCYMETTEGNVKLQFLAGLQTRLGRVEEPLICDDNKIRVASLRDLFATKLTTIQMRAEIKDYLDIAALLKHGLTLEDGLACAQAVYGVNFDPGTSLRALCSYRDGDLPQLPATIRNILTPAALAVDKVPTIKLLSPTIG